MRLATVLKLVFAAFVFGLGGLIWSTRLDYSPETRLNQVEMDSSLKFAPIDTMSHLVDCKQLQQNDGWVLLVVTTKLEADGTFRGYFETAPESRGIFAEYDAEDHQVFRIGIAGKGGVFLAPIRTTRRNETIFVAIGIQKNQIRIVSNGSDRVISFPTEFQPDPNCQNIKVGTANGEGCGDCGVAVRYSAGFGDVILQQALNELSNSSSFNVRRLLGTTLTILSLLIAWLPVERLTLRRAGQGERSK